MKYVVILITIFIAYLLFGRDTPPPPSSDASLIETEQPNSPTDETVNPTATNSVQPVQSDLPDKTDSSSQAPKPTHGPNEIAFRDEFFGTRSYAWHAKFGKHDRTEPISAGEIIRKLDFLSNWETKLNLKFRKKLVNLDEKDDLYFSLDRDTDLGKLFSENKTGKFYFHESRLVDPRYFHNNAKKTAFCSMDIRVIDTRKIEFQNRYVQTHWVQSVSLETDQFKNYTGVSINFRMMEKDAEVHNVTCYAYKRDANDETYNNLEVHHLMYSIGAIGSSF